MAAPVQGAPFSLPLPDYRALRAGILGGRGAPGSLPLDPTLTVWLVPPPSTPAPGPHLAPPLFREDLAIPTGISGMVRVPTLSAPREGSRKETSIHSEHSLASAGCQACGHPAEHIPFPYLFIVPHSLVTVSLYSE